MGAPFTLGRPTTRARILRNEATDAERRLWKYLRGSQLGGYRFSRQMPIGPFICDFVCRTAKLIVEVDGGQHDIYRAQDEARTRKLQALGYDVIRFWNNDVNERIEGVLILLQQELDRRAHPPTPSRLREGEL